VGLLGNADDDVRKVGFLCAGVALVRIGQVVVDFPVRDDDAAFNFAVAQAGEDDLLADFLAELDPGDAITFEHGSEFGK
jgi:hypothetical protein